MSVTSKPLYSKMDAEAFQFDVLKPDIISIGKRKYRKLPYILKGKQQSSTISEKCTDFDDDFCDEDAEVEQTEKGYCVKMGEIPSYYFKFICGRQNENKKQIEKNTNCHIAIPRPGNEGDVVITGASRSNVLSAKSQVELTVESARFRQKPTHFLSIPLAIPTIKENFTEFKGLVLEKCHECRGMMRAFFQNPDRLHLTLGMMVLMNEQETSKVMQKMETLKESLLRDFLDTGPLKVSMTGIQYMNDDPAEVDVLYAKVQPEDGSNRLQDIVDRLVGCLTNEGLMKKEYDRVKLHVTIMNTIFRDPGGEDRVAMDQRNRPGYHSTKKHRSTFDARRILELFQDFDFGPTTVSSIQLSTRGKYSTSGFYESAGDLSLITQT